MNKRVSEGRMPGLTDEQARLIALGEAVDGQAEMLRRAATACWNAKESRRPIADWFDWVPKHLDQLADRLDAIYAEAEKAKP